MNAPQPKYRIYPTLLDKYQQYLSSDEIYNEIWGFSEEPSKTAEEFERECWQSLIDGINRVTFEPTEAASKGTAFNILVDEWIAGDRTRTDIEHDGFYFQFERGLLEEFANYFEGAVSQMFVSGILPTKFGDVELYGYVDVLF